MAKKADHEADRQVICRFDQIINIGPAMARDFVRLGMERPQDLIGQDPVEMYEEICRVSQMFHDPCVLDTYMATVDYMDGNPPKQWWDYTSERKLKYSAQVAQMRAKYLPS